MNRILTAISASPMVGQHPFNPLVLEDIDWSLRVVARSNSIMPLPKSKLVDWVTECDSTLTAGATFSPTHFYVQPYPGQIKSELKFINQLEALNLVHTLLVLSHPDASNYNIVINMDNLV